MSSIRMKRVAEEIQKVLSERLLRGLRDPLPGFVTIKHVEVTSDFTHAKVYYSVFGSDAQKKGAKQVLDENRGALRGEVGRQIRLRNTPELHFFEDNSAERAARVHDLLREAQEQHPLPGPRPLEGLVDPLAPKPKTAKPADDG